MKIRNLLSVLFILLASECPAVASAGNEADYIALQSYCIDLNNWSVGKRQGPRPSTRGLKDIVWFNHYCAAIDGVKQMYSARTAAEKRSLMHGIEQNVEYTIKNNPGHYLLPTVYAFLGNAYFFTHDYANAEANLLKALSLDPRHASVYITLAELYKNNKRLDKAEQAVRAGLDLNPDLKSLKRIARELGITVEPAKPAAETVNAKEEVAATPPVKEDGVQSKPPRTQTTAAEAAATPPQNRVENGRPDNPWCRFCPDTPANPPHPSPSTLGVAPKADR